MTYGEFLSYAAGPGVSVVVGVLLSLVMEWERVKEKYDQLSPATKRVIFYGLCFVVPLGATVLGVATEGWDSSWPGVWWTALSSGFVASGIGTLAHARKL